MIRRWRYNLSWFLLRLSIHLFPYRHSTQGLRTHVAGYDIHLKLEAVSPKEGR